MHLFEGLKDAIDHFESGGIWENEIILQRNEMLIHTGDLNTNFFYLKEGSIRVFLETDQEEITFRFAYETNFVGALDTIIAGQPSRFNMQALKKCVLLPIQKSSFDRFLQSDSRYAQLWQELLKQVILDQGERELDLLTKHPLERYMRVLKRSPRLFQEIPHKYIASYLRMSPETLSRLKKS